MTKIQIGYFELKVTNVSS